MPHIPKASVFIPSYNYRKFLPECIDSILAQSFQDFEIVIVDDGSKDGSHDLLLDYQRKYPKKIFYHWHPDHSNRGISATSNYAIKKSRGEYLAWTGADDVWYPNKLYQQVEVLDHNPRLGFVYSYVDLMDGEGNKLDGKIGKDITQETNPIVSLLERNWIPASTIVFRKECLDEVGLFREDLTYSDWEIYIRILANSDWQVEYLDYPLAIYRIHSNNVSADIKKEKNAFHNIEVLKTLFHETSESGSALSIPRNRSFLSFFLAKNTYDFGEKFDAEETLINTLQSDPEFIFDDYFKKWLTCKIKSLYQYPQNYRYESDIGLWVLSTIKPFLNEGFQKKLNGLKFASKAYIRFQEKDFSGVKKNGLLAILTDHTSWIFHKGLVLLVFEALIGPRMMSKFRRVKRAMSKSISLNL
jgi:glycosyltransferase involved in cell wall biosynthesis